MLIVDATDKEFARWVEMMTDHAQQGGADLATFIRACTGDRADAIIARIQKDEAQVLANQRAIEQFEAGEGTIPDREWITTYRKLNLSEVCGTMAWDEKYDMRLNRLEAEYKTALGPFEVHDLDWWDKRDSRYWCADTILGLKDGETKTWTATRIGNYLIEHENQIPMGKLKELITYFG